MMRIRAYKPDSDFAAVKSWVKSHRLNGDFDELHIPQSSYVLVDEQDRPQAYAALICTNVKAFAYIENLVSNPELDKEKRQAGINDLIEYISLLAKGLGYHYLIGYASNRALEERYKQFGATTHATNLAMMVKRN